MVRIIRNRILRLQDLQSGCIMLWRDLETHERTLSGTGYYGPGQLYLSISKDENWVPADGKAGTTEAYKDKEGRIVLKRTFNKNEVGTITALSTYYVYDDLGNLSFVLPPEATSNKIYVRHGGAKDKSPFKIDLVKLEARMMVYKTDQATFLKKEIDTLFLLESYDPQHATVYGTITDRKNSINYKYVKKSLTLLEQSAFTDYEIKLVSKWDTLEIRKELKLHGNLLGGTIVNASRCYRKQGNWDFKSKKEK